MERRDHNGDAIQAAGSDRPARGDEFGRRLTAPIMVGRGNELERIEAAVASPPAVVAVEGEVGVGKTRLLRELAGSPPVLGRRVLVGSGRHIRHPFPLGPVLDALRGLDLLAVKGLSPVVGALRPLLPELARSLPRPLEPLRDPDGERHRVFRALVELLTALEAVVLMVEDLHTADRQTIDFLRYLIAELPPQLSLVITYCAQRVDPDVRTLTTQLPPSVTRAQVRLMPLDAGETAAMAAAMLGVEQVPDEVGWRLYEQTAGLPFAIEETLGLFAATATAISGPTEWVRLASEKPVVPAGVRDSVLERVSQLSPEARLLIEGAAALRIAVPTALLATAAGLLPDAIDPAVDEALQSGLLAEWGETVAFQQPLAAQAVYENISGPRRRTLEARVADALAGATGNGERSGAPADGDPPHAVAEVVSSDTTVLAFDSLVLDTRTREVRRGSRGIDLTPTEFRLLELLMRNARQVLTHELIFERVWGFDFTPQSNTLRVYVGYLRSKIEAAGERRLIHTVRGVGYVFRT